MASPGERSATAKGGWKAAIFIIMVEIAERFSFYAITSGLITYMTTVLGEPTASAAKNVNMWQGVAFLCPLIGAFVADSLLGRFKTVFFSSIIYLFGLVLLFISASVIPANIRRPFFYISLYILAIGQGGHKPSVQTFAADQFDESTLEEKAAKSSFFNWWFFGVVVGATLGVGSMFFVQKNVGWATAFGIPTAAMLVALVVFLTGIRFYRREGAPAGSPFTMVAQVFVAAAKKRCVTEEKWGVLFGEENRAGPHVGMGAHPREIRTNEFRWLDKAMVVDDEDASASTRDPWRLSTLHQVEEVKQVLRLLPIWVTAFPFSIIYAQFFTFFVKQANTMRAPSVSPHFKIPPANIPFFVTTTIVLVFLVLYERAFIPTMRKITGIPTGITTLQRIGIGQFLSMVTMVIASLVEHKRVRFAKSGSIVSLSVWWLLPQYVVLGLAEVFVVVGMQQVFYEKMPEKLRSLGAAAYLSAIGIGSFISSGIIVVVQMVSSRYGEKWLVDDLDKAHLDGFYWVLAGLCGLGFCGYVWVASGLVHDGVQRGDKDIGIDKELQEI